MDMMSLRRRVLINQNKLVSVSGNPLTFNTPLTKPLKECVVRFTPEQEGSGTPSPDNVRNIVGRSSVKLWQSGKNLAPPSTDTNFWTVGWLNTNGTISASNNPYLTSNFIKVKGGDTYVLQVYNPTEAQPPSAWKCYGFYDSDQVFISDAYQGSTSTSASSAVVPDNAKYMRISFTSGNRNTGVTYLSQLEFGSEATAYESYSALNEITFSWDSDPEIGTIYGGYVDCETADLVAEYAKIQLSDLTWSYSSGWSNPPNTYCVFSSGFNGGALFDSYNTKPWVCNALPSATRNEAYTGSYRNSICFTFSGTLGKGSPTLRLPAESVSSIEEAVDYIANNNITVAYKLETPLHYPLTPQSIATLRGGNVMWSDANGDITVRYWTR